MSKKQLELLTPHYYIGSKTLTLHGFTDESHEVPRYVSGDSSAKLNENDFIVMPFRTGEYQGRPVTWCWLFGEDSELYIPESEYDNFVPLVQPDCERFESMEYYVVNTEVIGCRLDEKEQPRAPITLCEEELVLVDESDEKDTYGWIMGDKIMFPTCMRKYFRHVRIADA